MKINSVINPIVHELLNGVKESGFGTLAFEKSLNNQAIVGGVAESEMVNDKNPMREVAFIRISGKRVSGKTGLALQCSKQS